MEQPRISIPKLDFEKTVAKITNFIREIVEDANVEGVVVGLSGGVDSSVVATLCVRSLGKAKVLGILLPTDFTPQQDVEDAFELSKWLGIRTELIDIHPIAKGFSQTLQCDPADPEQRMPVANILPRIRMTIFYYYANLHRYLVVGTGDRSEDLIGYFTKYGDGGVDFLPISHLYKTQVRALAQYLGVPRKIALKPSSPQLYPGHKATDEIPVNYERLDLILVGLYDQKLSPDEVCNRTGIPIDIIHEVQRRFNESKHKRAYPRMVREY
jgi:NAD+ synthase